LEAVHASALVALGHLLVQNAASGGHPLHVAGGHAARVAEAVAVLDLAGEHIGDGLDAAMRMPRKSGQVIGGIFVAKIVQEQERIEVLCSCRSRRRAASLTPAPSMVGLVSKDLSNGAKRHG
jgi:hypothetical protein